MDAEPLQPSPQQPLTASQFFKEITAKCLYFTNNGAPPALLASLLRSVAGELDGTVMAFVMKEMSKGIVVPPANIKFPGQHPSDN